VPKRLSEKLKDTVVEDYLSGITCREIIKKHRTYELYSILKERNIEYKQNNDVQKEKYKIVIDLYNKGEKIENIVDVSGSQNVYQILKKYNIERERNPKEYNTNKKQKRNQILIEEYLSGKLTIIDLCEKYNMSSTDIYRILKVYNITPPRNKHNHWVINQKLKETPNMKCKFYILDNYYGYTKIGITTKNTVRSRYRKNINVIFELDETLNHCYNLEVKIKRSLKSYMPKNIDKTIDGWSECYEINPIEIIPMIENTSWSILKS
jgi:hypothetical protein